MLRDGQPFFLDYQGGRKGALQYDIASLLYDGKADLPPAVRQQLLDYYLDCLAAFIPLDRDAFMEHYYAYVYVRIMQALGAYGFRGFYERKAALPPIRSLRAQESPLACSQRQAAHRSARADRSLPGHVVLGEAASTSRPGGDKLTVRIFSFSFHREIPTDESGNGGGFVFDARSLPNPGREERFMSTHRQRRAGHRLPESAAKRSPVFCPRVSPWSMRASPHTSAADSKI